MKKISIILFVIFILALILRTFYLPQKSLTFGYDQARDAYRALEIANGHLKILGPPSSTPGLYHGVFYYYLLAPAYKIGNGNPIIAAYWIAFLNAATVFIVYALTLLLTKNKRASLLAAFFFAISFDASQYAVWLSNPTIGVWTVALVYLGLWSWVAYKKPWAPILTGVALGLSIQAEIFLAYHLVPVLIWLWLGRKNINKADLLKAFVVLLLSISTLVIAEFKFGFRGLEGARSLLGTNEPLSAARSMGDFLILYMNQLGKTFAYSSYPGNIGYGGTFILGLVLFSLASWYKRLSINKTKRDKNILSWEPYLATWLLCHITVVSVGGTSTPFLLVGTVAAIPILLGIVTEKIFSQSKLMALILAGIIVFGNTSMILKENKQGQTIFAIQKDMLLSKQLEAIDYTYSESNGTQFSVNTLTSPLWINIVWTYLYNWYGQPKYGYTPFWHGRDQVGQLASLNQDKGDIKNYFLILEPMGGIPIRYLDETVSTEDSISRLLNEKYFGELRVQKRIKL